MFDFLLHTVKKTTLEQSKYCETKTNKRFSTKWSVLETFEQLYKQHPWEDKSPLVFLQTIDITESKYRASSDAIEIQSYTQHT